MRIAALLIVLLLSISARADGSFEIADGSRLTYHIVHKLHHVDAVSRKLSGKALLFDDGRLQVAVRVPADSFDSGSVNRDEHQKETVEAARYPLVELKGIAADVKLPAKFPATFERKLTAQITFHGVAQRLEIPVAITVESASSVRAEAHFAVSLDAFKIERPSLMFIKIDDEMKIDAELIWNRH